MNIINGITVYKYIRSKNLHDVCCYKMEILIFVINTDTITLMNKYEKYF